MPLTPSLAAAAEVPLSLTVRPRPSDSAIGHFVNMTQADGRDGALKLPMPFAFEPHSSGAGVARLRGAAPPKEPPPPIDPVLLRKRAQHRTKDLMAAVGGRLVHVEDRDRTGVAVAGKRLRSDFHRMALALNEMERVRSGPLKDRHRALAEKDRLLKTLSPSNRALSKTLIRLSGHPALAANEELKAYLDQGAVGSHNELFRVFHAQYSSRVAMLLDAVVKHGSEPHKQDDALGELQGYADGRISILDGWIQKLGDLRATKVHGPLRAAFSSGGSLRDPKVRAEIRAVVEELKELKSQLQHPDGLAAKVRRIADRAPEPADFDPFEAA